MKKKISITGHNLQTISYSSYGELPFLVTKFRCRRCVSPCARPCKQWLTLRWTTREEQSGTLICLTSECFIKRNARDTDVSLTRSRVHLLSQTEISTCKNTTVEIFQSQACALSSCRVCLLISMRCPHKTSASEATSLFLALYSDLVLTKSSTRKSQKCSSLRS